MPTWLLTFLMTLPVSVFAEPFAYVANRDDGTVSVVDTATNAVSAVIPVGTDPRMIAFTPDGTRAYVTDFSDDIVSVIATATNTVIGSIPVNGGSTGIAITPDGTRAYVADNNISVIDTRANAVTAAISAFAYGIAIVPDGTKAYATSLAGELIVLDITTNTVMTTIDVGGGPVDVAITPDGTKAYVAGAGNDSTTVAVVDTRTNTVTAEIPVGNEPHYTVAITPDGTKAYVAGSTLWVLDTRTNTVTATITDVFPLDIAMTPDGTRAYVTGAGEVAVIDTATDTITDAITFNFPWGIAITPALPSSGGSTGPDLTDAITKVKVKEKDTGFKLVVKVRVQNNGSETVRGPFSISLFGSDDESLDVDEDELLDTKIVMEDLLPGEVLDGIKFKRKGLLEAPPFILVFTSAKETTLRGNAVKAPLQGATVTFYVLNADGTRGPQLGQTTTDAQGTYAITLRPVLPTPILAEATGGFYIDEITSVRTTLNANDVLTAALPAGTTRATVNPLTHMAAVRAQAMAGQGIHLATAVDAANAGVAGQYQIPNTLHVLPASPTDANELSLATWIERTYGIILGGLAWEASTLGVRAIDLGRALADDLSDGVFDGNSDCGVVCTSPISITVPTISGGTIPLSQFAGTARLQEGIDEFVKSAINNTNLTAVKISENPVTVGNIDINQAGTQLFYITSPVLPAWTENQFASTTLTASGGTPPYKCALKEGSTLPVGFSLNGCILSGTPPVLAGGTTMTITTPFTVTIQDSADPPVSKDLELRITILRGGPTLMPVTGSCTVDILCKTQVASATGGTAPYSFRSDTFADGPPPLGTAILTTGELSGTIKTEGTFNFRICVVDSIGNFDCGTTSVKVVKATGDTITCENDLEIATGPAATCQCDDLLPIFVNGQLEFQPVLTCSVDTPETEITKIPK